MKKFFGYAVGSIFLSIIANEIFYRLHLPSIESLLITKWEIPRYIGNFLKLPDGTILFLIILILPVIVYFMKLSAKENVDKSTKDNLHLISGALTSMVMFIIFGMCLKSCGIKP